jgi:hypothetical protein
MTPLGNHLRILQLSIIFTLITVGNQSLAQEPSTAGVKSTDPHTLIIQQSIALMEQSQWQQTLDLLKRLRIRLQSRDFRLKSPILLHQNGRV